nr:MAG TPA: hypothetical protein [Caudoviricetes sp.]
MYGNSSYFSCNHIKTQPATLTSRRGLKVHRLSKARNLLLKIR